jgi:hypothetical protein
MARSPDMTELLDIEKPGLTEWKDEQDAPLDAARASQLDLVDRSKLEELKDLLDAEYPDEKLFHNFMRDGLIGPMLASLRDHAAGDHERPAANRVRKPKDPNVKFGSEIEALRYWWASAARVRSGASDRIAQRIELGAIQTSCKLAEPTGDPYIEAISRAVDAAGPDFILLAWRHVEFTAPKQRTIGDVERDESARAFARWEERKATAAVEERAFDEEAPAFFEERMPKWVAAELVKYGDKQTDRAIRERFDVYTKWVRQGRKVSAGEETVRVPARTPVEPARGVESAMAIVVGEKVAAQQAARPCSVRWEGLLAERLGLNVSGELGPLDPEKEDDPEALDKRMTFAEASARIVRARYAAARQRFKHALWQVELDVRPKYVIAAPLARELDDHARDAGEAVVEACMGIRVADGLRQPCEVFEVEGAARRHPTSAWPRCDVCGRPRSG